MSTDRATSSLSTRWMCALVSVLGAFEMLMAFGAGSALTRVVGIVGGLALGAAPWLVGRANVAALALLVAGIPPFVALTATSLVPSVLALVAWILMALIYRDQPRPGQPATSARWRTAPKWKAST
jgi:hypothetical protein